MLAAKTRPTINLTNYLKNVKKMIKTSRNGLKRPEMATFSTLETRFAAVTHLNISKKKIIVMVWSKESPNGIKPPE